MRAGDPEFERAVDVTIDILRRVAQQSHDEASALITYGRLSELLAQEGLRVPHYKGSMPHILEEASRREQAAGRAMLSALVVQQAPDGRPSEPSNGFFRLARRAPFNRVGDDTQIWLNEVRQVRADNPATDPGNSTGRRVATESLGAWMIKCNPEVWDFAAFLENGGETIDSWSVVPSYRTALMAEGQRILFWVTGRNGAYPEPGLWGDGVVIGPVKQENPTGDTGLWIDEQHRRRTRNFVPVDIQLFDEPVARRALKADRRLADLEIFRQPQMANPLAITQDEVAALDEHLPIAPKRITITDSGAGFGNPTTRAAVEEAAMIAVTEHYKADGWAIDDVSAQCLGWDLACTSLAGDIERVEVKGVSGLNPIIFLTRNEARAAGEEPGWRLAVVTRALAEPDVRIVDGATALAVCQPFMFEVDLNHTDRT